MHRRFDVHLEDSLNNRFKPLPDVRTDAIFSVDDDLLVPCETLEFAFELWTSAPDQLVGFVPRMHWRKKVRPSNGSRFAVVTRLSFLKAPSSRF